MTKAGVAIYRNKIHAVSADRGHGLRGECLCNLAETLPEPFNSKHARACKMCAATLAKRERLRKEAR